MFLDKYENKIDVMMDPSMVAFEIKDENLFYTTGYKVIQNFPGEGLIRAVKSHHNGNIRLVYDVSELVSLSGALSKMDPDTFKGFALGLLEITDLIGKNGFIQGYPFFICMITGIHVFNPEPADTGILCVKLFLKLAQPSHHIGMGQFCVKIAEQSPGTGGNGSHPLTDKCRLRLNVCPADNRHPVPLL